ncbi:hypothetical protein BH93_02405 [Rhodococcoides fascians A25f]|uniref:replication-relaxation family protein n=1 Tax=Rhodococcoides fascians TaxID=1828 RepID=UPI00055BFDCA|nr:replication-relaxation family protein [Rhodococcus fascians]QII04367.1 hypothetical protein BH93_02405 [Rhodococcus fascians A25f]
MSASSAARRGRSSPLSDRDLAILRKLQGFRLATGDHLRRLHFTEGSPITRDRRCRSVLKRLTDVGLIGRLDRRVGGLHGGSQGFVYSLQGRGSGALARLDGTEPRRPRGEPGERFVAHVLAITETYVRLHEATGPERRHELLSFDPEPTCWRRYPAPHGGVSVLRPDAYVRVADTDYEDAFFVEIDRATESLTTIRAKCQAYAAYWRSGTEQASAGVFPKVVWIVPSEHRAHGIRRTISRLNQAEQQLFTVTTEADALSALLPSSDLLPTTSSKGGATS